MTTNMTHQEIKGKSKLIYWNWERSQFLIFSSFTRVQKTFWCKSGKSVLDIRYLCYTLQLSRNQRFSASFHHTVETLVNMMMPHITQKYKDNLDAARNANHSLAVFIKVGGPQLKRLAWLFISYSPEIVTALLFPYSSVALFQPDGQRLCVQADQQLHQLLYARRPKGIQTIQTLTAFMQTNYDILFVEMRKLVLPVF